MKPRTLEPTNQRTVKSLTPPETRANANRAAEGQPRGLTERPVECVLSAWGLRAGLL